MNLLRTQQDSESEEVLETAMVMMASALSDPSRVSIPCALMDGHAWTTTELSTVAEAFASTTSGHPVRLFSNRLMVYLAQGRYRYYRLAGAHIAALLENLTGVSIQAHKTLLSSAPVNLRCVRTCYDHLAGELAVNTHEYMLREKWLAADGLALTPAGKVQLECLGAVLNIRPRRRPCCPCLDWSGRRFHLGGDARSALMALSEQKGRITRTPGYREVQMTDNGRAVLSRLFNLRVSG